jgi:transposase
VPDEDVYRCPSGHLLPYHYTNIEHGMTLRRYWSTAACQGCAIKSQCTPSKERRITR